MSSVAGRHMALLFETVINKIHVKVKFNLTKMKYKGRIEV